VRSGRCACGDGIAEAVYLGIRGHSDRAANKIELSTHCDATVPANVRSEYHRLHAS
jgi:hypothetical protein